MNLTPKDIDRFWAKVHIVNDGVSCWEWIGGTYGNGYGALRIDGVVEAAHRVAFTIAYGNIQKGLHVLHTCDRGLCVRPGHLYAGTPLQNARDREKRARGNHARGVANGKRTHPPKLSETAAAKIYDLYTSGRMNQYELAAVYNVSQPMISNIVRGRAWDTDNKETTAL